MKGSFISGEIFTAWKVPTDRELEWPELCLEMKQVMVLAADKQGKERPELMSQDTHEAMKLANL